MTLVCHWLCVFPRLQLNYTNLLNSIKSTCSSLKHVSFLSHMSISIIMEINSTVWFYLYSVKCHSGQRLMDNLQIHIILELKSVQCSHHCLMSSFQRWSLSVQGESRYLSRVTKSTTSGRQGWEFGFPLYELNILFTTPCCLS
jgi:hypothetical protein